MEIRINENAKVKLLINVNKDCHWVT